jgi:hypothetical protein
MKSGLSAGSIGSGEIRNPSLKSDRDRRRLLTALQGEVAGADQMAQLAVAISTMLCRSDRFARRTLIGSEARKTESEDE